MASLVLSKCWSFVKGDVLRVVKEFHEKDFLNRCLNDTFITLIPKKERAKDIGDNGPLAFWRSNV